LVDEREHYGGWHMSGGVFVHMPMP